IRDFHVTGVQTCALPILWAIASLLGFAALLLRAGVLGATIGSVLGPTLLIRALAACVMGRMENLTVIFFGAVGLGVLEQAIFWRSEERRVGKEGTVRRMV